MTTLGNSIPLQSGRVLSPYCGCIRPSSSASSDSWLFPNFSSAAAFDSCSLSDWHVTPRYYTRRRIMAVFQSLAVHADCRQLWHAWLCLSLTAYLSAEGVYVYSVLEKVQQMLSALINLDKTRQGSHWCSWTASEPFGCIMFCCHLLCGL